MGIKGDEEIVARRAEKKMRRHAPRAHVCYIGLVRAFGFVTYACAAGVASISEGPVASDNGAATYFTLPGEEGGMMYFHPSGMESGRSRSRRASGAENGERIGSTDEG